MSTNTIYTDYKQFPPFFSEIHSPVFLGYKVFPKDNGRLNKVPVQINGHNASSTDESTWCTLPEAIAALEAGVFQGIGIILIPPMTCVDLDGLRNPETGELHPVAQDIIATVPGWIEQSVSRSGVHIFGFCDTEFPFTKHSWTEEPQWTGDDGKRAVEIYQQKRFMALTGWTV